MLAATAQDIEGIRKLPDHLGPCEPNASFDDFDFRSMLDQLTELAGEPCMCRLNDAMTTAESSHWSPGSTGQSSHRIHTNYTIKRAYQQSNGAGRSPAGMLVAQLDGLCYDTRGWKAALPFMSVPSPSAQGKSFRWSPRGRHRRAVRPTGRTLWFCRTCFPVPLDTSRSGRFLSAPIPPMRLWPVWAARMASMT